MGWRRGEEGKPRHLAEHLVPEILGKELEGEGAGVGSEHAVAVHLPNGRQPDVSGEAALRMVLEEPLQFAFHQQAHFHAFVHVEDPGSALRVDPALGVERQRLR